MNHTTVLKRAWHMVRHYRALWIFGIILALTVASWETAVLFDRADGEDLDAGRLILNLPNRAAIVVPGRGQLVRGDSGRFFFDWQGSSSSMPRRFGDVVVDYDPPWDISVAFVTRQRNGTLSLERLGAAPNVTRTVIYAIIGVGLASVVLFLASRVARYVSDAALIRMVDQYEEASQRPTVRQGLRLGWSRTAWRLFLINWAIGLPGVVVFVLLFALVLSPLFLLANGNSVAGAIGVLLTMGFLLAAVFVVCVVGALISVLKDCASRACAVDGLGVIASIRRGYATMRGHPKDVGLMWLILVGVSLVWTFVSVPVGLLLMGAGVVLGGMVTLLVLGLSGLAFDGATVWILTAIVGVPIGLLVLAGPWAFLGGLREVFKSSAWTLTYRELCALDAPASARSPEVAVSSAA